MSKYLLYTVGEIVLVVIGILIALQINNWNEKRKADVLSQEMVSEIKSGIESDLTQLQGFMASQQSVLRSQYIVSNWLKSNAPYHDSLSVHFSKTYISTDFTINHAGYETLKKFGMRRINNDSLRISISGLYEIKYPTFIKYTNIYQDFLKELLTNNENHFNELNYIKTSMRPLDANRLRADQAYSYHLNSLKNFNQLLLFQGGILTRDVQKVYQQF